MGNVVARRYARALFAIGQKGSATALTSYGQDLTKLGALLAESPELLKVFRNPVFNVEQKKAVLEKVLTKLNLGETVSNLCNLLAEKNRLAFLPEIQAYYSTLLDESEGIVRGRMTTAVELSQGKQSDITGQLAKQTGRKVQLAFAVDQKILGGLVLKVGDTVFDASLRAQLDILKENIKRGE